MFWQEEDTKPQPHTVSDEVVDLGFTMQCKQLPIDHAWALQTALLTILPWLAEEPLARIHSIHVAESSNGWMRPDHHQEQVLIPSHRTKLYLRLPNTRLAQAQQLTGQTLLLDSYTLTLGAAKVRHLQHQAVVFARYIACLPNETEEQLLQRMADEIQQLTGVNIKKMLCGKSHYLYHPQHPLLTRQLMLADLDHATSIKLQQYGLGTERLMGCGILLPHKGIQAQNS
ncbi:type I-MYXAN CRISPR-associated protein Cas6/Cmx6 [Thiofilum flexile]|uniref:type I-MYXAN CRISPR-associated protein Cas6/Cmx6 n=1 Tax=Thiofilum flexile TaxID=125627 RepID=UPI000374D776|nr:type I-MYXAN CRISPR-associated protein Cas6/Cmx6 [Thiofilum flexile]